MVATILVRRISDDGSERIRRQRRIALVPVPSRPMPRAGGRARIAHFGGGYEGATVLAVHDDGRRLLVRADGDGDGERREFILNAATATFREGGSAHGVRLELLG
jgi:hypothetical protein